MQVLAALAIVCVLLGSEAAELHREAANAWQEGSSFWLSCNLIQALVWRQLALLLLQSVQLANLIVQIALLRRLTIAR